MQELPLAVKKVWGQEDWLINEPEYCFKFLEINKGASCSLHYHPIKKETFILTKGKVKLELDGKTIILGRWEIMPITIFPKVPHRFTALIDSILMEISTHHDDNDVVRIEKSKA